MTGYELFLIAWWGALLIVLIAGIGYAIKEARRHRRRQKRRRVPLTERWWKYKVGDQ